MTILALLWSSISLSCKVIKFHYRIMDTSLLSALRITRCQIGAALVIPIGKVWNVYSLMWSIISCVSRSGHLDLRITGRQDSLNLEELPASTGS